MSMKKYLLAAGLLLSANLSFAADTSTFGEIPENRLSLEAAIIEEITLDGGADMVTLKLDKVCLEGQAYLAVFTPDGVQSLAPAYKMGEPEQCSVRVRHHKSKPIDE
jgi:hypothetical protein